MSYARPGPALDPNNPHHQSLISELLTMVRGGNPDPSPDPVMEAGAMSLAYQRYNGLMSIYVPWLQRLSPGPGTVVEIGCGSGSSTAAFATICGRVIGYDFVDAYLDMARRRLEILGVRNAEVRQAGARDTAEILAAHPGVDGVILYAVLEHMTISERLDTLRAAWAALKPGGFLLVGETPNRLSYWDAHTTEMPFMQMLPVDLALDYYDRTSRTDVKQQVAAGLAAGRAAGKTALIRTGYSGASFHEFELALGPNYASFLISSVHDPEIQGACGDHSVEEAVLADYCRRKRIDIDPSFTRAFLTLLFRKP